MKYVYILIAVVVVGAGAYFAMSSMQKEPSAATNEIPDGYHAMPDGTLMENARGTEGMGALDEFRQATEALDSTDTTGSADMSVDANAKVFSVKGVNYGYDIKEIRVKKGDIVIKSMQCHCVDIYCFKTNILFAVYYIRNHCYCVVSFLCCREWEVNNSFNFGFVWFNLSSSIKFKTHSCC